MVKVEAFQSSGIRRIIILAHYWQSVNDWNVFALTPRKINCYSFQDRGAEWKIRRLDVRADQAQNHLPWVQEYGAELSRSSWSEIAPRIQQHRSGGKCPRSPQHEPQCLWEAHGGPEFRADRSNVCRNHSQHGRFWGGSRVVDADQTKIYRLRHRQWSRIYGGYFVRGREIEHNLFFKQSIDQINQPVSQPNDRLLINQAIKLSTNGK